MSQEDKVSARRMAQTDLAGLAAAAGDQGMLAYDDKGLDKNAPDGNGDQLLVVLTIGSRSNLSKRRARAAANAWREATHRYPNAGFTICLIGYDDDPREIWDIPEAARYVRRWARYAGLDDIETADRFLGSKSPMYGHFQHSGVAFSFLAACGIFGEEPRRAALAGRVPISTN